MIKIVLKEPIDGQKVFITKDFFGKYEYIELDRLNSAFNDKNTRALTFTADSDKTYTITCDLISYIQRS